MSAERYLQTVGGGETCLQREKLTSETVTEVIVCIADNDQILWLFKIN